MTDGLTCTSPMPLAWQTASLDESERQRMMREAALLLNALNQTESSHDLESGGADSRRFERLEAKLDLVLHLLARSLEPDASSPIRNVTLSPLGVEWSEPHPPIAGADVIVELRPSEQLPLTLRLPARARDPLPGVARASLVNPPETLDEALHQFVFRRHRQAIRARAGG